MNTGSAGTGFGSGGRHHAGGNTGTGGMFGGNTNPGLEGGGPAGVGGGGTGTGVTGGHRGPIRAVEDMIVGTGVGGAGGAATNAPGQHTAGMGTGTGTGMGPGTGAGYGAGAGAGMGAGTGAGYGSGAGTGTGATAGGITGRPSAGQRILGDAEKLTGHLVGNPNMVVRGQEKKTGMPATVTNTGGFGTSNAASGPGARNY